MKFNINFAVNAICNQYKVESAELIKKGVQIELFISKNEAANFIFRFAPNAFDIEEYHIVIKYDEIGNIKGIVLLKDDDMFVVTNTNHFFAQVAEGYIRSRTTEKIVTIMEFDFESADRTFEDEFASEVADDLKENK